VLLSDVSAGILTRYDTVIVAHALKSNPRTISDRLGRFVADGGQLVLLFDSLADLASVGATIGNVSLSVLQSTARDCPVHSNLIVRFVDGSVVQEPHPQRLCQLQPPAGSTILATTTKSNATVAYRTQPNRNGGSVTIIAIGNYGVTTASLSVGEPCQVDKPTLSPQPLSRAVAHLLSEVMTDQALFDIGGPNTSLSWVPKRLTDTEFIIGISNTQLNEQPLRIQARFGTVVSQSEVPLDNSEKGEPGYLPHGFSGHNIGQSTSTTIAGADFRMLKVTVKPSTSAVGGGINALHHAVLPPAPTGVWLKLRSSVELQPALQRRIGFKQSFDGVLLDWSYLSLRTMEALQNDASWLHSQRLKCGVDLSSAINLFPGLRLGNFTSDCSNCHPGQFYNRSLVTIQRILHKCSLMHGGDVCRNVFLTLHDMPELGPPPEQVKVQVATTVKMLAREAASFRISLHLRHSRKNTPIAGHAVSQQQSWARGVGIEFAPNSGLCALDGVALEGGVALSSRSFLLLDGVTDLFAARRVGSETPPLLDTRPQLLRSIQVSIRAAISANATLILDASYNSLLQEEAEVVWLGQALAASLPAPSLPQCYRLGSAQRGICSVRGDASQHQQIIMGCPPGQGSYCYADYMRPNATWAGDYETHFDRSLTSADVAKVTTQMTEAQGKWTITVSLADGKLHSWTSPSGYISLQNVTQITCGVPKQHQLSFKCAQEVERL
jgi:hypothetical protein